MPDVLKWIKSQFYTNSWTFASDVKKSQFSHSYCSCHACIWTFRITILHKFLTVDPDFVRRGCAGSHQICILPHVWMSDLRDLCRGLPVPKRNSHSTTCLDVRNARSPQTIAAGKEVSHFTTPHVCPPTCTISAESCPKTNKTRISPQVWVSDTPQRVTFRKPPPGCPCR